jgi:hypothetical protein
MQAKFEVAHILRAHWPAIEQSVNKRFINTWQLRTLSALGKCRTGFLGGHVDGCTSCGHLRISYNSCRNRHCPKCQGNKREAWIQARQEELMPVAYFHVVFTIPSELNSLCMQHPHIMYSALFDAAWKTISTFAGDKQHLGATTGMISILHTWGQQLTLHPHLHCIVPGGGLTFSGKWRHCKTNGNYLFPVKALSKVFRAKYFEAVRKKIATHNLSDQTKIILPKDVVDACFKKPWVVYAKKPFSGVDSVVEYLGRYTHKIAISNHRIVNIDNEKATVTFKYKDYKENQKSKLLCLNTMEFVRRFSLHILPKAFVRIRHYGILSSTSKAIAIAAVREQLPTKKIKIIAAKAKAYNTLECPRCKKESMLQVLSFDKRGPPQNWKQRCKSILHLQAMN